MRPIATDMCRGPCMCLSVCLCVCHVMDRYPAKTAGPIGMLFGMWGGVGHSNHVLDGGLDPSRGKGNFEVGKGRPIAKYSDNGA